MNGLLQEQAAGTEVRTSGTAEDALPRLALSLRLDPLSARPMLTWLYGEHAGVAVGDLLLSVNGQRPATVEAAETLLLKASCSGMPIDLEVCAAPRGTEATPSSASACMGMATGRSSPGSSPITCSTAAPGPTVTN